jgi:hypothetical protein
LDALKAAADNPEGSFTSAAAEAARSPAAETGPALPAPALAALALAAPALAAPALAAPALAAPAVWAEGEEGSATGLYGCTKPITTVAVGGLRSSWPASRLPVLSSKAWPSGSISSLCALKKSTPIMGKATSAERN